MHTNFVVSIRIVDKSGYFLSFSKAEFKFLISLVINLPEVHEHVKSDVLKYSELKTIEGITIKKSSYSDQLYEITHESDIENVNKLIVANVGLIRLFQIYDFVMLVFENIGVEMVENEFYKIIDEAKAKLSKKSCIESENIREFFMQCLSENSNTINPSMRYLMLCDILANFEDFFKQILKGGRV